VPDAFISADRAVNACFKECIFWRASSVAAFSNSRFRVLNASLTVAKLVIKPPLSSDSTEEKSGNLEITTSNSIGFNSGASIIMSFA